MHSETDTDIIRISIALITATAVIFQSIPSYGDALKFTIITSASSLAFCLLLSIWHKARWPKREAILKANLQAQAVKMRDELARFYKFALGPMTDRMITERFVANPPSDLAQVKKEIDVVTNRLISDLEPLSTRLLQSYTTDFESVKQKSLNAPLQEKCARLCFFFDYLAMKTRIFLFVVGFLLFLVSIILRIITDSDIAKPV